MIHLWELYRWRVHDFGLSLVATAAVALLTWQGAAAIAFAGGVLVVLAGTHPGGPRGATDGVAARPGEARAA